MKKLLVTGASGFIGSSILSQINPNEYEVYATAFGNNLSNSSLKWIECNLLDQKKVDNLFKQIQPECLIHLAWNTEPSNYDLPINYDWLNASINIVKAFRRNGGKRLLVTGSGVEYDWKYGFCNEEDTPTTNNSIYGACKNILRQFCESYAKSYNLSLVWARLFFIYGPNEHKDRLIPHIITSLLQNKKAIIRSGELFRDYLSVMDYASAIVTLFNSEFNGVVNIGSGQPTKIKDLALLVGEIMQKRNQILFEEQKEIAYPLVVADTSKLIREIDWKPKYSLESGLMETIESWKRKL